MTAILSRAAEERQGDSDALTTEELAAYFAYCQEVADTADADPIRPELESDVSPEEWAARGRRWAEAVSSCTLISPRESACIRMRVIRATTGPEALVAGLDLTKALEVYQSGPLDPSISEVMAARGAADQRKQERLRVAERVSARGPDAGRLTSTPVTGGPGML